MTPEHIDIVEDGQRIYAECWVCGDTACWPNKGLGRANKGAWVTRHQHPDAGV